jgi:succinate dehydrogenase / fumarate reductase cytochrome b subunit
VNEQRPVNLDIGSMALPITAIASITHRITGVILFFGLFFMLWATYVSLQSAEGFEQAKTAMSHPLGKFITWGILSAVSYHFIAGLKHLLADMGIAEEIESGKIAVWISWAIIVVLIVLAGAWVW